MSSTTRTERAGCTGRRGGKFAHHDGAVRFMEIEREPERAALPFLAVDADRAAHRVDQLFADAKTKPGAAV